MAHKYKTVSLSGLVDDTGFSILQNNRGKVRLVITHPYQAQKVRLFDTVAEAMAYFCAHIGEEISG